MTPARHLKIVYAMALGVVASAAAGCDRQQRPKSAPILVFAGTGTSAGDRAAIARILDDNHLEYATATSAQLNRLNAAQLLAYRLIIVPGGNFIDMSASLTTHTTTNIREAVHRGVNYLGICAGAFLAGDGHGRYNGVNLTSGVQFHFYAAEARGIRKAAVAVTGADSSIIEQYWEDGPELTGWGAIVAKYPDGTPAVVEGTAERGRVILAGVHPEAPDAWRRGLGFTTPANAANIYAGTLIQAALAHTPLAHF